MWTVRSAGNPDKHFTLNPMKKTLYVNDALVPIGSVALKALACLIESEPDFVPEETLRKVALGHSRHKESPVRRLILELRKALGDKTFIENRRGVGYRLVGSVEPHRTPNALYTFSEEEAYSHVGSATAKAFLGMLDTGETTYGKRELLFDYTHEPTPLPDDVLAIMDPIIQEAEKAAEESGRHLFNGPIVRLHSLSLHTNRHTDVEEGKSVTLHLRPTRWYDYLVANQEIATRLPDGLTIHEKYADVDKLMKTRACNWVRLSNILTVTLVAITRDGWMPISHRTGRVASDVGSYTTSAAENMHRFLDEPSQPGQPWSAQRPFTKYPKTPGDYEPMAPPNPFYTVKRAIHEELSHNLSRLVDPADFRFDALAWGIPHFQPVLNTTHRFDLTRDEFDRFLKDRTAVDAWESNHVWVPFEPAGLLKRLLVEAPWVEPAKAVVMNALVQHYGSDEVERSLS